MPEPNIVRITISPGGEGTSVFPADTTISVHDSVFWFNDTSANHQPAYQPPTAVGQPPASPILWGPPPDPLPPQQTSSQVVFTTAGTYPYFCTIHTEETGTITVT